MTRTPLNCFRLSPAVCAIAMGVLALHASPARADGLLGGFIGINVNDEPDVKTAVYGGQLAGVSRGLGFGIDFGYSPDFFDTEEIEGFKTSITTLMGNLIVGGATARGVAPYASGGVGLIRANIHSPDELFDELTSNDFGMNVGGGVNVMFASNVGITGDVRYFRSFRSEAVDDDFFDFGVDLADFDFWRFSGGMALRW